MVLNVVSSVVMWFGVVMLMVLFSDSSVQFSLSSCLLIVIIWLMAMLFFYGLLKHIDR